MSRQDIDAFEAKREEVLRQLEAAVREEYPVGTYVYATLGGHDFEGTVVRHGNWWYEPEAVFFRNVRTGKERRASATFSTHNLRKDSSCR